MEEKGGGHFEDGGNMRRRRGLVEVGGKERDSRKGEDKGIMGRKLEEKKEIRKKKKKMLGQYPLITDICLRPIL